MNKLLIVFFILSSLLCAQGRIEPRMLKQGGATNNQVLEWNGTVWAPTTNSAVIGEVDNVDFDSDIVAPSYLEGRLFYDQDSKALSFYNENSNVTMQMGQELWVRAKNITGLTLDDGDVVYINGAVGASGTPTVALALADSMDTVKQVGVVTADILNNEFGYVTVTGIVRGIDTDGLGEGNLLYVSASVAGDLTVTAPTSPNFRAPVAYVVNDHVSSGSIFVFRETATIGAATTSDYFRGDESWQSLENAISPAAWTFTNKMINSLTNSIDADAVHVAVRNESGGIMSVGASVYISGYSVGQDLPLVNLADADDSSKMPAYCMIETTLANNATGGCILNGRVTGVGTGGLSVGDDIYVSTTPGVFTITRPTGISTEVQKLGLVLRAHASLGVIEIIGAGRVNDVPNVLPAPFAFTDITLDPYNATCDGSDISTEMEAAIAASVIRIYMPPGCFWEPSGDLIPGELHIIGGDWKTTEIASADTTGGTGPFGGHLSIGPFTRVENVAIKAEFCTNLIFNETGAYPSAAGLDNCPVGEYYNNGPSNKLMANWPYNRLVINMDEVEGNVGELEGNAIVALQNSDGGSFFAQLNVANAVGFHSWPIITSTIGYLSEVGIFDTGITDALGIRVDLHATDSTNKGIYARRIAGASGSLFEALNLSTAGKDYVSTSATRTSGDLYYGFHTTSAFNGTGLYFDFGNGGGSHGGNFFDFRKAGVRQAALSGAGILTAKSYQVDGSAISGNDIANVAAGNIVATDVQAAIDELDGQIDAVHPTGGATTILGEEESEVGGGRWLFDTYGSVSADQRTGVRLRRARNTKASPTAVGNGDAIGTFETDRYNGSAFEVNTQTYHYYDTTSGAYTEFWHWTAADAAVLPFAITTTKVIAYKALDLEDPGSQPTCDSTTRGQLWFDEGAGGVADTLDVCAKDSGDAYAWRTIY